MKLLPLALLLMMQTARGLVLRTGPRRSLLSTTRLQDKKARVPTTPEKRWEVQAVGVVDSPYADKFGTPKQATISRQDGGALEGRLKLFPGYEECIAELQGFDYVWVLSLMHLNKGFKTKIRPQPRAGSAKQPPAQVGLFCSRSPHRPNPIALSCLKVTGVDVDKGIITVLGLDLLHDTPILDIKPYIPAFDAFPDARAGWMDDITADPLDGRSNGYQDIYSSRGMRMARRNERLRKEAEEGMGTDREVEGEGVGEGGGEARGDRSDASRSHGQALTCETTGSCRSTRAALKQELEAQRQARALSRPADYLESLAGAGASKTGPETRKSYSPFRQREH